MKRQTGPVIKEVSEAVLENEGYHERKRQRLNRHAKDVAIGNLEKMKESIDEYGFITTCQYPLKFSEAQTSTPIAQNGSTNDNVQESGEPVPTDNSFITANNIIPTVDNGVGLNGDDTSKNGMMTEVVYHDEPENNLNQSEHELIQNSFNNDSEVQKNIDLEKLPVIEDGTKEIENNPADTVPPKECQENALTNLSSFQYDCDSFLNSFLKVTPLKGHNDTINSVIADGNIILSASDDTTVKMWDSTTMEEIRNFQGHNGAITALLLLSSKQSLSLSEKMNLPKNERIIISASLDCSVRFWDISSGAELSSFYTFNGITRIAYMEELYQIALSTEGGKLELWDLISLKVLHSILAHQEPITCLQVDDCYIYTASTDGLVKVWLIDEDDCNVIYTRRRMQCSEKPSLTPSTWSNITSHDGLMYLSDNTSDLKVLNWREGHIQEIENNFQTSGVTGALHVKEDILFSAFYDLNLKQGGVNVWKLPSVKYECTLMGNLDKISHLAVTMTDDKIVRVVTAGKELLVWDFITAKPPVQEKNQPYYVKKLEENVDVGLENGSEEDNKAAITNNNSAQEKARQWCMIM